MGTHCTYTHQNHKSHCNCPSEVVKSVTYYHTSAISYAHTCVTESSIQGFQVIPQGQGEAKPSRRSTKVCLSVMKRACSERPTSPAYIPDNKRKMYIKPLNIDREIFTKRTTGTHEGLYSSRGRYTVRDGVRLRPVHSMHQTRHISGRNCPATRFLPVLAALEHAGVSVQMPLSPLRCRSARQKCSVLAFSTPFRSRTRGSI